MPQTRPAGPFPLPGVRMTTWMIRFDRHGKCVSPATQAAFLASLGPDKSREIIFFSHGWKTDFDGAEALYAAFLRELEALSGEDSLGSRDLVFVGITWPSQWFPGANGPVMAGGLERPMSETLEDLARDLDPDEAQEFYGLAEAPSLEEGAARRFIELLESATRPEGREAPEVGDDVSPPDSDTLLEAWRRLRSSAPGKRDFNTPGLATGAAGGPKAAGGGLDPIDAVRVFSLYQMKDRAGRVGAGEVSSLLSQMADRAKAIYAVGHSFGCKVMLSAVKKAQLAGKAPTSLLLLQPALSHLAFSPSLLGTPRAAGYADVPGKTRRIFSTFSRHDWPLHDLFHIALIRPDDVGELDAKAAAEAPPNRFAALGGYGPREIAFDEISLTADLAAYAATSEHVVSLIGDAVIGDHSDVKSPETARALRRMMG